MATIKIDFRSISWGGPNEDDSNDVWQLEDTSSDPASMELANFGSVGDPIMNFPAPPTYGAQGLGFAFWNVTDGTNALPTFPSTNPALNIPTQAGGGTLQATAWYAPPAGPGGAPILRARTFDIDLNGFRKETPIQAATPTGAWPGPNSHSVSTEGAAASASPKGYLLFPDPQATQPPGVLPKAFKKWQPIVGDVTVNLAQTLTCTKMKSGLGLAFYGHGAGGGIPRANVSAEIYDFWGEFWGRLGVEGEGPFGPGGPGSPWGPRVASFLSALPAEVLHARLQGQINVLQTIMARIGQKE